MKTLRDLKGPFSKVISDGDHEVKIVSLKNDDEKTTISHEIESKIASSISEAMVLGNRAR